MEIEWQVINHKRIKRKAINWLKMIRYYKLQCKNQMKIFKNVTSLKKKGKMMVKIIMMKREKKTMI